MLSTTSEKVEDVSKMDSSRLMAWEKATLGWEEILTTFNVEDHPKNDYRDSEDNPTNHLPPALTSGLADKIVDNIDNIYIDASTEEFIAIISHELRTPLTSIRGAIGLLLSGKLGNISPKGKRMLEIALSNTDRLERLTNVIESDPETQAKLITTEDLDRLRLGNDLRSAIHRQELEVHYQSIVNLETSEIQGFEALVRWRNQRLGVIPPDQFIPIAEESDLINPLGLFVLKTACQQLHQWQQEFPRKRPLTMSVNVSGRQLENPEFILEFQKILQDIPLAPDSLRLEITESVLMENQAMVLETLHQIKELGIKIYIDDFGTGYSSLSRLYELPVDVMKIDKSFIHQQKWDLIYTLMLLAHSRRLDVIVEGVETKAQCDRLLELGCVYGQGYLFAKPVKAQTATEALVGQS
ncbi:MAG: EAL domain-containing protein [Coleofasciculaceae cyanobacterium SM2_1_6]|nr:EAL domain-containing protein [Coleofasciculaceae cyanobacterium SM2_1_6]